TVPKTKGEMLATLPDDVRLRVQETESEIRKLIEQTSETLKTELGPISFTYSNSAPSDVLTDEEQTQSISFVSRYQHLPSECIATVMQINGNWYIRNLDFLRHTLNDYRPIIQNESDIVYYKKVHSTWWAMLSRNDDTRGTVIRAWSPDDTD